MDTDGLQFIEKFRTASNPFRSTIVKSIWEFIWDTPKVHSGAHDRLWHAYEDVKATGNSLGVTILGDPGVGKSHLLNRFRRKVHQTGLTLVFQVRPLHGEASGWFCHIVNSIISGLLLDTGNGLGHRHDQIRHIMEMVVPDIGKFAEDGRLDENELTLIRDQYQATRTEIVARIEHAIVEDAFKVFSHFVFNQFLISNVHLHPASKAVHEQGIRRRLGWLKGLQLDKDELKSIHAQRNLAAGEEFDPGHGDFLAILKLLGELTKQHFPIVLVIDQIETLSDTAAQHYARQLHSLLDETPNFLVITSGVREKIAEFRDRKVFQEAAFNRLAERTIELAPPPEQLYLDLVHGRTRELVEEEDLSLHPEFASPRCLFPFTAGMLEGMLSQEETVPTPRQLIAALRDLFEECQLECSEAGSMWLSNWPDVPPVNSWRFDVDAPSSEERRQRIAEQLDSFGERIRAEDKMPDLAASDQELRGIVQEIVTIATDGVPNNQGPRMRDSRDVPGCVSKAADLALWTSPGWRSNEGSTSLGLVFDSRQTGQAIFHTLHRIADHAKGDNPDPQHIIIVRDARSPLKKSWVATWKLRQNLESEGSLTVLELDRDEIIRVLALGELLHAIKSRDLVIEYDRMSIYTVSRADLTDFLRNSSVAVSHPLWSAILEPWPPRVESEGVELKSFIMDFMRREKIVRRANLPRVLSEESCPGHRDSSFSSMVEKTAEELISRGELLGKGTLLRYPV